MQPFIIEEHLKLHKIRVLFVNHRRNRDQHSYLLFAESNVPSHKLHVEGRGLHGGLCRMLVYVRDVLGQPNREEQRIMKAG